MAGRETPDQVQRWTPAEAARFLGYMADDPMGLAEVVAEMNALGIVIGVAHAGRATTLAVCEG